MSPIEAIGTLIIRLWAAALLFVIVPDALFWYSTPEPKETMEFMALRNTIYYSSLTLLSVSVWMYAHKIAKVFTPKTSEHGLELAVNSTDLVTVGSFLIGLSYLVDKLPSALFQTSYLVYQLSQDSLYLSKFVYQIDNLIEQWVFVLVALGLTFRPRDIARMFMWLRPAGPQSVTDAPEMDGEGK